MKVILFISFSIYLLSHTCVSGNARQTEVAKVMVSKQKKNPPVDFTKEIQPILEKRCSPCHFTGGKMYEKMPFDKAATILQHSGGIMKRIKDEKENALFKSFIKESLHHTN